MKPELDGVKAVIVIPNRDLLKTAFGCLWTWLKGQDALIFSRYVERF